MSFCCSLLVAYEVQNIEKLQRLGAQYAQVLNSQEFVDLEACRLLDYIQAKKGIGLGPRGDMFTWGSVGNYVLLERFVEDLRDFWLDLFTQKIVHESKGIVILSQREQQTTVIAVEIVYDRYKNEIAIQTQDISFPLFGWHRYRNGR